MNFRARYGRTTVATVDVSSGADAPQRVTTEIAVRDIFIAGLGDSIASGEGNPDRPVALSDEGFCFRSYLGMRDTQYYRPSRAGYKGGRACEAPDSLAGLAAPERAVVQFGLPPLALQLPDPHRAGARRAVSAHRGDLSAAGLHRRHHRRRAVRLAARARMPADQIERASAPARCRAQLAELREAVTAAKRRQPDRKLDLVLLSIGANDINFSGLVADVIVDTATERVLFRRCGVMGSVDDSRAAMTRDLPQGFGKLREALKPLVGGDMSRVVYRLLCQSDAGRRRRALPRRPRRLRHPPLVQRRAAAARQRLQLCAERIPAAVEGDGAVPERHAVPRSRAPTA